MNLKITNVFAVALPFLLAPGAQAHHSWGAIYNGGQPVNELTATISSEAYRNPHETVDVTIVNDSGEAEVWKIEWRGERSGRGMGRGQTVQYDLNPGDEVVINGRTARDPDRRTIQMTTLTRVSDGMTIQAREGRGGGRRGN